MKFPRLVDRARHSAAEGFTTATIELPGSGDRPRRPAAEQARADLRRALEAGEPVGDEIVDALVLPLVDQAVPERQAALDALLPLPAPGLTTSSPGRSRHNGGMSSVPQRSAFARARAGGPAGPGSGGTDLRLYREKFRRRLPSDLLELRGPAEGIVEPPATVVWSGLRAFDLGNERQRMSLYRTVLAEGMREDLCTLLNHDLLLRLWPTLRILVSTTVRDVWEEAFPELRALADLPAAQPPARRRPHEGAAVA